MNHDNTMTQEHTNRFRAAALTAPLFLLALLLPVSTAQAGGFAVSEVSSRASGRGGAAAALSDEGAAIYFNPANIALQDGFNLQLGVAGLMPRWQYTNLDGDAEQTETTVIPPPHVFLGYNLGDAGFGDIALGVGFFVPYGSTFNWEDDWSGRQEIQEIGLSVFEIAPAIAVRPHEKIAIGATFRYLPASVYMRRAIGVSETNGEGSIELGGTAAGMGFSAGMTFLATDQLTVGLSYRSQVDLAFTGKNNTDLPDAVATMAIDGDVETDVPLAQIIRAGVAFDAIPNKLNLSADFEYQMWSAFESLDITIIDPDGTEQTIVSPRNSKDSIVLHLGGEFNISDALAVRAGYAWDQHTLPEETVNPAPPDSDKHALTLGVSYDLGMIAIHTHFTNAFFSERTTYTNYPASMQGTWSGAWPAGTMAYVFGLSVSGSFDVAPPLGGGTVVAAPEPTPELTPVDSSGTDSDLPLEPVPPESVDDTATPTEPGAQ